MASMSQANAGLTITFANGDQLEGDEAGDVASYTDGMTSVSGTLTTRRVTDSMGNAGSALNPNSNSLGVSGGSSSSQFDGQESWTFDWDVNASFTGIQFGSFTSSDSFKISSSSWVGLSGVIPGTTSSSYDSSSGTFTLTDYGTASSTDDNFDLAAISGGVALDLAIGDDVTIMYGGSNGAIIENISFSLTAVPEPSSATLFGLACFSFGFVKTLRRNRIA